MGWGERRKKLLMTLNPNILKHIQQNRRNHEGMCVFKRGRKKREESKPPVRLRSRGLAVAGGAAGGMLLREPFPVPSASGSSPRVQRAPRAARRSGNLVCCSLCVVAIILSSQEPEGFTV